MAICKRITDEVIRGSFATLILMDTVDVMHRLSQRSWTVGGFGLVKLHHFKDTGSMHHKTYTKPAITNGMTM